MNKIILAIVVTLGIVTISGCDYFSSPEQKAFAKFVAKCKADPSTADCKAWKEKSGPSDQ